MVNEREQKSESTTGERVIELWGVIARHFILITFMGSVGCALGYLYFLKTPPTYQSTSSLLIVNDSANQNIPFQGTESAPTNQITRDNPHSLIVVSPAVVARALEMELGDENEQDSPKRRLRDLPYFFGMENPTAHIISRMAAKPGFSNGVENPSILNLAYRDLDGLTTKAVLDAVIESYKEFLGTSHKSGSKLVLDLIEKAKDSLGNDLIVLENRYAEFRQNTPLIFQGETKAVNPHKERMSEIEVARNKLVILRTERRAQLDSVQEAINRGEDREAIALMLAQETRDTRASENGVKTLQEEVYPLLIKERMLLHDLGPQHPKVVAAQKQIEVTRELFFSNVPEDERPRRVKKTDFLTVCVEAIKHEIRGLDAKISELDELFEDERHEARSVTAYENENEMILKNIARKESLYQGVVKRLDELTLLENYGGFKTNVISPPVTGYHVAPNFMQSLMIGAVCGAMVGFGLGYLLEKNDKTFHSPEEISEFLNLPIVGHVPVIQRDSFRPSGNSRLDKSLVSYHKPKSRLAEAYRGIRTSLYFSTRGEQHKVIQLTSPNPGDGKTTLSANLAISIAQSGKRVVLIDADFRRPRIHKLFGVNPAIGMCSVLNGDMELPDAIQQTDVENLWVLPCGPRPGNPCELLTSRRFEELLEVIREQYDFVLVDTPPVLVVTDPSAVAARVDGVIVTFRLTKRTRFEASRATEQLLSIGGNILGVVVNGVGKKTGYGGYGGYSDRSYGGYQYSSQYGDGYGKDKPYYAEDDNAEPATGRTRRSRRKEV